MEHRATINEEKWRNGMTICEKLMRPDLRNLAPYSSARMEARGAAAIALDANENPFPSFGAWAEACGGNRYPEPQPAALRARLAALWNVAPERILQTRGSDEGIDLLIRLFCRAGEDEILICPPTFGMYEVYAEIQGARVLRAPLREKDGHLDLPAIEKTATENTKLIFIPSPNAPMGHAMRVADILELAKRRDGQSLIVIDEAYVAFSDAPDGFVPHLKEIPNLVILRTLSKAQALAGERFGAVIAPPDIIARLQQIQAPYPLPQSTIKIVGEALSPAGTIEASTRIALLKSERERLRRLLKDSPAVKRIYSSEANFLLIEVSNPDAALAFLARYGVRVRDRQSTVPNALRISVGTPEENDILLKAFGVDVLPPATSPRLAALQRSTKETKIDLVVDLDNPSLQRIETGIGFFDHMIAQISQHGGFGLALFCKGDLQTGQHHTIEDCGLALGSALKKALGDRHGIGRYGFTTPLDEALAEAVIDLSGRPYAELNGAFPKGFVGDMEAEMVPHFFESFAASLGAAIHLTVKGDNSHHCVEACFKAVGRALRSALKREGDGIPSTKGVL
jgi:histidinol-phosphate aminotransferase/imidazoleglycerol-phosphate dehydratase/histidinol-phosphatase